MNNAITTQNNSSIEQQSNLANIGRDLTNALADFLRLKVADGDASELTIKNYYSQINSFVEWCNSEGIEPARASEDDIILYRRWLIENDVKPSTINVKLSAIRKIYDAACWRGLRPDNPASGIKAPRDETAQEDKILYLPLEGLKTLLNSPNVQTDEGMRDKAILTLMGYHA